jgi:4-hydroxy-3-polyprenylbenzoate decarboxylase
MKRYVLGMSGASGPVLGVRVLRELVKTSEVHLIMTDMALSILKEESGIDWTPGKGVSSGERIREYFSSDNVHFWPVDDLRAPAASGSFRTDGMVVVPCSVKTLAGIAAGFANNLLLRAADVTIKEGRPLLLCPRETPLSPLHLENMLKLARIGVRIVPPVPAFYHRPESLEDMMNFLAGKLLDAMGVEHALFTRWGGQIPRP